jgi:hypothetical protein
MKLIMTLCLSEGFDTFPTLLCADGCSMIDRRMVSCSRVSLSLSLHVYVCDYAAVNFNIYASQNAFKDQVI